LPEFGHATVRDGHGQGTAIGFNGSQGRSQSFKPQPEPNMSKHPSIRDQLEQDAWRNYPRFALRQADSRHRQRGNGLGWQDRTLLILAALLVLLLIVRVETARAQPGPEAFWGIEGTGPGGARSVALDTDMRAEVTGLTARVRVSQHFRNDGAAWKEAVYRFPLPAGAAVDRLRIEAGGRVIEGEIRERDEARRQYQQARTEGRVASLVEQQRPNQFETRLANIGPGEEIRVEISFLAAIDYRDGTFSLRLPLTFTPRWDPADPGDVGGGLAPDSLMQETDGGAIARKARSHNAPQPLLTAGDGMDDHYLTVEVVLRGVGDLVSIESRYHDVEVQPLPKGYRVYLADPDARSDRLFDLGWTPDFGAAPVATLSSWDAGDAVYAQLMLTPPLAEALAPRPREVVFVIDTSGSMEGTSIRQARSALRQGLDFLDPDDLFNLVRFDSNAELLFAESAPPTTPYQSRAIDFIDGLHANGGTNMAPALDLAMGLPPRDGLLRQIIFITDGSVGNEQEVLLQVADKLGDSRLFTVAIGSAPNLWFMRKAAEIGRGTYTLIGRQADVSERMSALWARIENPAVQNVCVDWGMEAEFYPQIIPDLYAGEPLWLYAKLPFEPREITLCGELDGHYWETTSRANPVSGGEDLAILWARSNIEALEDSRIFGVEPATVRREVLDLALEFGLLTPYTSLVAVDRTPARPAAQHLGNEEVPGLLPAGSTLSVGFAATATGWPLRLAMALLALFLATGMLLYIPPSRAHRAGGARQPGAAFSP
jgi:Ca-activated chloride channel family protein